MQPTPWQIKVRLRKDGAHELTVTTRSESGALIRSNTVGRGKEGLGTFIDSHNEAVSSYDIKEHERAHNLAVKNAQLQADE